MSNTPPFDRLHRAQQVALISILSGDSRGRTAALAEVTDRTIRRWQRQPDFQAALTEARRDFFSACRSHLNSSRAAAFQTLVSAAAYSGKSGEQLKAVFFLLAQTQMSANPSSKNAKQIDRKRLRRQFGPKRPDMGGPERTLADTAGLRADPRGR